MALALTAALGSFYCPGTQASAVCSSLNGPFCSGVVPGFPTAPHHASSNLDRAEEVHLQQYYDHSCVIADMAWWLYRFG